MDNENMIDSNMPDENVPDGNKAEDKPVVNPADKEMPEANVVADDTKADDNKTDDNKTDKTIVGIRFPNSGKTYCFDAGKLQLSIGDRVVVESDLGINIGQVAKKICELKSPEQELKLVLRKVTEVDLNQEAENEAVKLEARQYGMLRIEERKLPMKLLSTDVTLDRKRFIFYFVADTRIDFRDLVKDLASKFRTRIELRQVGVRDAAKMVGGYGICGQELCCKTWLKNFAPISIKMAKQQDLVLNTAKLSGLCGRLMCCLNYEYDPNAKKRKPVKKAAPTAEEKDKAMQKAVDNAMASDVVKTGAEGKGARPQRRRPDRPVRPDKSGTEAKTADGNKPQSDADKDKIKKKRRRRGRGGKGRKKPQGTASTSAQGTTSDSNKPPQQQGASSQPSASNSAKQAQGAGDGTDKPKKKRRRRPRKKKPTE